MVNSNSQFAPQDKKPGDLILSADWNSAMAEIKRLEQAKVNRNGDTLKGPLTIQAALNVTGNVGIGTTNPGAKLTIQQGATDAGSVDDGKILFVSGSYKDGTQYDGGIEFRHDNLTQGIGFGYNSIYATGSNANQPLNIYSKGSEPLTLNAYGGGSIGIGTTDPKAKLHIDKGRVDITASDATGGGGNRFDGLIAPTAENYRRAQLVLSSGYSDLVIASSQGNDNHGSTLTFATYNPANASDYRKWVINQGNWGVRKQFLEFGYSDSNSRNNPHTNINNTDTVITLDGVNKRVGIGTRSPEAKLDIEGDAMLGYETTLSNFGRPLKSGFYQNAGAEIPGDVPDTSHAWTHLITARHSNTSNNHQLQIAAAYISNDRLFFRKIQAGLEVSNPTWHEVATRGTNTFVGNQTLQGNLNLTGRIGTNGFDAAGGGRYPAGWGGGVHTFDLICEATCGYSNLHQFSSIKEKENIRYVTGALEILEKLNPVYFDRKKQFGGGCKNEIGFIAEEVREVCPELVQEYDSEKPNFFVPTIQMSNLPSLTIAGIKELSRKLKILRRGISVNRLGNVGVGSRKALDDKSLYVQGDIRIDSQTSTTASSGEAVLPEHPAGFLLLNINGEDYKIPYYNV